MEFEYFIGGGREKIEVEVCKTLFSKFLGLMFKKNSKPLLFVFKKEKKLSIHSFFCKPFKAIWLDDKKNSTRILQINRWKINFSGRGKYLLEIPVFSSAITKK